MIGMQCEHKWNMTLRLQIDYPGLDYKDSQESATIHCHHLSFRWATTTTAPRVQRRGWQGSLNNKSNKFVYGVISMANLVV
jgi:hypothetical protein